MKKKTATTLFVGAPLMSSPPVPLRPAVSTRTRAGAAIARRRTPRAAIAVGDVIQGRVSNIAKFGAFVDLPGGGQGLVHISEISSAFVQDVSTHLHPGDEVEARVISMERGRVALSIRQCQKMKTGYERVVELGGDFGDAWNRDGKTEWTDLGERPDPSPNFWEEDPALFRRFDEDEGSLPDVGALDVSGEEEREGSGRKEVE